MVLEVRGGRWGGREGMGEMEALESKGCRERGGEMEQQESQEQKEREEWTEKKVCVKLCSNL